MGLARAESECRAAHHPLFFLPFRRPRRRICATTQSVRRAYRRGDVTANVKVLVVDDNEPNRLLARAALEDEGYEVHEAASGNAGVDVFARERPSCVVLDVRMQDGDGFEACERIRGLPGAADVPILFLTALRDVDTFDRARKAGGDDFLTKPVRPNELVLRIRLALAMKEHTSELDAALKKQSDDLLRAQLQKERLAAFVVHDLKNPVNAMDLHAQLLLRDKTLSPDAARSVQQIRNEARHLTRMILNLLDVTKSDEGKLVAKREPIDVRALFDATASELAPAATARKVQIAVDLSPTKLVGDADLLGRALVNLTENAIRHAPAGTTVRLSVRSLDDAAELRVSDDGPGIPSEKRAAIFEPFTQLDPGGTRAGRGLGLSFCKIAAEAHGGTIAIEDTAVGTTFVVKVPS